MRTRPQHLFQALTLAALATLTASCGSDRRIACIEGCAFDNDGNCTVPTAPGNDCGGTVDDEQPVCTDNSACSGPTPICDTAANDGKGACITCKTDTDCTDAAAPRCDAAANSSAGACVACTQATEAQDCQDKLCDAGTCTEIEIAQTRACRPCQFDRQCQGDGARCLELNFNGQSDGKFCLQPQPDGGFCAQPFVTAITVGEGESTVTFCGIDQSTVSCGAIEALQNSQTCNQGDDASCNAKGALCRIFPAGPRCTYGCGSSDDCPATGSFATCNNGGDAASVDYCGG